jgi:hypothetical protein
MELSSLNSVKKLLDMMHLVRRQTHHFIMLEIYFEPAAVSEYPTPSTVVGAFTQQQVAAVKRGFTPC